MAEMNQQHRSMSIDSRMTTSGSTQGTKSINGPHGDNSLGGVQNCFGPTVEAFNGVQQKYGPPSQNICQESPSPSMIQPRGFNQPTGYHQPQAFQTSKPNQIYSPYYAGQQQQQIPSFDSNQNQQQQRSYVNGPPNQEQFFTPTPNGPVKGPPIPREPVQQQQQQLNYKQPQSNLTPSNGTTPTIGFPLAKQTNLPLPNESGSATSLSPAGSETTSSKSSRNPSPIPTQRYDAMEGQFSSGPSPSASYSNLQQLAPGAQSSYKPHVGYPTSNIPTSTTQPNTQTPHFSTSTGMELPRSGPPIQVSAYGPQSTPLPNTPAYGYPQTTAPPMFQNQQQQMYQQQQQQFVPPGRQSVVQNRRQYPQQVAYDQRFPPGSNGGAMPTQPTQEKEGFGVDSLTGPQNPTPSPGMQGNYALQQQQPQQQQQQQDYRQMTQQFDNFNLQSNDPIDLLQNRNILPPVPLEPLKVILSQHEHRNVNCSPDILRCTLTKIPENQSLLQKSRLPLGILIHPFKDLHNLPVIQCTTIVRCRSCRTYINPFVNFVEHRRWKCNLCYRVNELPDEFLFDPVSKNYGDPARRPEIKSATIEFIAPSEYMLRPPQPAVYLYLLDVSHAATEAGYLRYFCDILLEELDKLPGDGRTQIGFITFDSSIHFYNLGEGLSQPQMMIVSDIDDIFLPYPDNMLVNLNESKELIQDLLHQLPVKFMDNHDTDSALGAALQTAFKLVSPTGGRVTVFQAGIPNVGPGALKSREDPNLRAGKDVQNLGPANDFYKKLSLDCSGQQVAVDLFIVATQYIDIATLSCISKYSGGSIHYYPGFHTTTNPAAIDKFEVDLRRYITRKIGFESVMRIRCTKGLSIHTFYGNFFVRSTDLLSLPNINPDAGFGMQISIEDQLNESNTACFQAALLYTSSKGERRIRVHTMCLPITNNLCEILGSADQQAIIGLVVKMAVDRSMMSSLSDAREALINTCTDPMGVFKMIQSSGFGRLMMPSSLRLLPMYILAVLKHMAFRVGTCTRLDERVYAMNQMKVLPLAQLMLYIYPSLYPVHALDDKNAIRTDDKIIPQPPLLQLSSEKIDSHGCYLLDAGDRVLIYICRSISDQFCNAVLKAANFASVDDRMIELPELENPQSEYLRNFVNHLQSQRPFYATFHILKEDSKSRNLFLQYLIEDRSESSYSYYEFLQYLKQLLTK